MIWRSARVSTCKMGGVVRQTSSSNELKVFDSPRVQDPYRMEHHEEQQRQAFCKTQREQVSNGTTDLAHISH